MSSPCMPSSCPDNVELMPSQYSDHAPVYVQLLPPCPAHVQSTSCLAHARTISRLMPQPMSWELAGYGLEHEPMRHRPGMSWAWAEGELHMDWGVSHGLHLSRSGAECRPGHELDMEWTSAAHGLGMSWTLGMSWSWTGHELDIIWADLTHVVYV